MRSFKLIHLTQIMDQCLFILNRAAKLRFSLSIGTFLKKQLLDCLRHGFSYVESNPESKKYKGYRVSTLVIELLDISLCILETHGSNIRRIFSVLS
jgi:hypothetical protein